MKQTTGRQRLAASLIRQRWADGAAVTARLASDWHPSEGHGSMARSRTTNHISASGDWSGQRCVATRV